MYGEVLCHSHCSAYLFPCTVCFTYTLVNARSTHTHNNVSAVGLYFLSGLYPLIGWRVGDEVVFVMEGASHDTGSLIKWAEQIGIIIIQYHTELPVPVAARSKA